MDDGVAWATLGAVGERVSEATIPRIADLLPARIAGSTISRDQRKFIRIVLTVKDQKSCLCANFGFRQGYIVDLRQMGWR
jgi:hypothetical protein